MQARTFKFALFNLNKNGQNLLEFIAGCSSLSFPKLLMEINAKYGIVEKNSTKYVCSRLQD